MSLDSVLLVIAGIGLFLFGMKMMGDSLQRVAGSRMEQTLERLTNNKAKGILLGTGVTAVIQSSSATIIMVMGFLNAGIMKLTQAVPVILGANIGTTATAQIIRLSDVSGNSIWFKLFQPSTFAPILIVVGAFGLLLANKNKTKDKIGIAIGLGILFVGINLMQNGFQPLCNSKVFQEMMVSFSNPVLGVLAGVLVTVLLQSSSASVGIVQTLASTTGAITYSMMFPIVVGANIGKSVTVIIASIGTSRDTKRAVSTDVIGSLIGATVWMIVIYSVYAAGGFDSVWGERVDAGIIANFHTLFNLATCLILIPCINLLIKFSKKIIKDGPRTHMEEELAMLDPLFINNNNPTIALQQSKKVMFEMANIVKKNYDLASNLIINYNEKDITKIVQNEKFLDKTETVLGEYLVKITELHLTVEQNRLATEMMHTVGDFERIGDHCINILEVAQFNKDEKVPLSDMATKEYRHLSKAVENMIDLTVEAYKEENAEIYRKIRPMEDIIDELVEILKEKHIDRLQRGKCTTQGGISWVEILNNMERIADHCNNICTHLHQRINSSSLDMHMDRIFDRNSEEFKAMTMYYYNMYCKPILQKKNKKESE